MNLEAEYGYIFDFLLYEGILCVLIEANLMSTHNILFSIYKMKITLNYPKSAALGFFQGDTER